MRKPTTSQQRKNNDFLVAKSFRLAKQGGSHLNRMIVTAAIASCVSTLAFGQDAKKFAESKLSEWPDAVRIAQVETHFDPDTLVFERASGDTLWASAGLWQVLVYYAVIRENRVLLGDPDTVDVSGYQAVAERLLTDLEFNFKHAKAQADLCAYLFKWPWTRWACQNAGSDYMNGEHYANKVQAVK